MRARAGLASLFLLLGFDATSYAENSTPQAEPSLGLPEDASDEGAGDEAAGDDVDGDDYEGEEGDSDDYPGKGAKRRELRWSGRLFIGDELTRQRVAGQLFWRNAYQVNSARVGMSYQHDRMLRAVIKLEFDDGDPELKDAYVRLQSSNRLRVQAGRFKRPMSSIALASRWDLPSVERGLLSTLDVDGLPFSGGRGDGAMLLYKIKAPIKPSFSLGLFESKLDSSIALDPRDDLGADLYMRLRVALAPDLHLASSVAFIGYLDTPGDSESFDHAPVGSLELSYQGSALRGWAEAFYGRSMFVSIRDAQIEGRFAAARALLAPRFKTGTPRRLVPFMGATYLDPRVGASEDSTFEVQGGVNLAFAKIWRLQLEVSHNIAEGDFAPAIESTAFRLQLGARFKE